MKTKTKQKIKFHTLKPRLLCNNTVE